MNSLWRDLEIKQKKIDAYVMPNCIGCLRKIAIRNSNWDLYYNTRYGFCESIAKPNSGASNSIYGNLAYIYRQIKTGTIKPAQLTKYGRRVLREKGYKIV